MCGIAGIIDFNPSKNWKAVIQSMLTRIVYRGPDECGIYESRYAHLGNVRLSIIDLENGKQPMSDFSGRFWIVFNGEIFNYVELRQDLERKGKKFSTHSDTEVLVNLYAHYGSGCLKLLNGQFSFAIWDREKNELFIARDRVGIRPLFYSLNNNHLTFASEIKCLLENPEISAEFDYEGLSQVYTFWNTIAPTTIFKNIFELPAGNFMIFNRKGVTISSYWQLPFQSQNNYTLSIGETIEKFDELLSDSVRIRLRANVEVAAFLSGGLDSSATISYIKKIEPKILNTFSIRFEDSEFDESDHQTEAVKFFDTKHQSILVTSQAIGSIFPKVIWHTETPVIRTAPAPMMMLSELVNNNNIKVVITGEGADEIFAGYDIFKEAEIRKFWAAQPDSVIRPILLKKLYPYIPQIQNANPLFLKMFFGFRLQDINNPFYSHLLRWNNSNHIKKHLSPYLKNELAHYSIFEKLEQNLPIHFNQWDQLSKSQWLETYIFMSGYLLSSQGDRMTMANSVEGRYPFLDYRVIEFGASLPTNFKLKGLNEKYIIKRMMENRMPESIRKRSKQAYRAPIKNVFISNAKDDYIPYMLSERQTNQVGIFDYNSMRKTIDKIRTSGISSEVDNMLLTAVISTHLLHHQYIEKNHGDFKPLRLKNLRIVEDL